MTDTTIIRDVTMFTPDGRVDGDCRIRDGEIAEFGEIDADDQTRTIRGAGRWLFPGVIDPHVHFRAPGFPHKEDWSSGSAAAVAGGVTAVCDMPNTSPTTTSPERLTAKRQLADHKSRCHFGLFFGATRDNADLYGEIEGVPGLKIFMGASTGDLLVDDREDLDEIFATWDGTIAVHAENQARLEARKKQFRDERDPAIHSEIRDPEAAVRAVRTASELAVEYGRHLHVLHLSTRQELEVVEEARRQMRETDSGGRITCEVCPHHLFLDTDDYEWLGTRGRVNPPLRAPAQREAMWEALRDGRIQFVTTDHAPHTPDEKDRDYWKAPSGLPGVQTLLPLMLDAADRGQCSPDEVVDWLAHRPASIYGMESKGRIAVGADADLTLVDPEMERTVTTDEQCSKSRWTPWEERQLEGWPVMTWVAGRLAYRRDDEGPGEVVGEPGIGDEIEF
ncbi:MAG: dihydroorotase [Bradymonadaceae bacterium]